MTSQKSLKNNFGFAFRSGLSTSFMPVLQFLAVLIFYTILPIVMLKKVTLTETGLVKAASQYKYAFSTADPFAYIIIFAVIVCSLLTGLTVFKFATGKKTVNVYYSLGIKRDKLFAAKYLSGLVRLVLAIALPLTVTLFANIYFCKMSTYLLQAYFLHLIGLIALSSTIYSITSAVCASVGTIFEGGIFSIIVIIFPSMLLSCIEGLGQKLMFGSALGISFSNLTDTQSLSAKLVSFDPLKFLLNPLQKYMALSKDLTYTASSFSGKKFTTPDYLPATIWILVSAIIFFIGMYAFQKRKAEIGGFIGTNRPLNFVMTFIVGFFAFSLAVEYLPITNSWLLMLAGLGAYLIVYCILDFILIRNFKDFFKGMKKLPIHLGITAVIGVLLITGFFGLYYKMPDINDIKYASVSSVNYDSTYGLGSEVNNGYYWNGSVVTAYSLGEFTDKSDIEKVCSINSDLYKKGRLKENYFERSEGTDSVVKYPIYISYTLNNGKTIHRYFSTASFETIKKMLDAENSSYLKSRQQEILVGQKSTFDFKSLKSIDSQETARQAGFYVAQDIVQGNESEIYLYSSDLGTASPAELTDSQRLALRTAIAKDLLNQTTEQKYFAHGASYIGILSFVADKSYAVLSSESDSYKQGLSGSYAGSYSDSGDTNEENDGAVLTNFGFISSNRVITSENLQYQYTNQYAVDYYITDDMVNTVALLKEYGIYNYFTPSLDISEVLVCKNLDNLKNSTWIMQFSNPPVAIGPYRSQDNSGYSDSAYEYKTSDSTEIKNLLSSSRLLTISDGEYYNLIIKYNNKQGYSVLTISKDDIPKEIASKLSDSLSQDTASGGLRIY